MSNDLNISSTQSTPEVSFSAENGELSMTGRSMPEDIGSFFDPILSWVKEYKSSANDETRFNLFFEYYNSSTARKVAEIIFELEEIAEGGKDVKINWNYKSGDLIMKENGEEIMEVTSLPIELIEH